MMPVSIPYYELYWVGGTQTHFPVVLTPEADLKHRLCLCPIKTHCVFPLGELESHLETIPFILMEIKHQMDIVSSVLIRN